MFNAVHAPLQALDEDKARYDEITHVDRRTYAAMLDSMDRNIGRVLDTLDKFGLADNTLVAFLSDNGGPAHDAPGHSYNMADNGQLRGHKFDVWEGGIRSPMIFRWPGRIPSAKRYDGLCSSMDLAATFLAAAKLPAPTDHPLDGVDLLPFLTGQQSGEPHDWLAWAADQGRGVDTALRRGSWKIVQRQTGRGGPEPSAWELYSLAQDISETRNLAAQHPEQVKEMAALFHQWRSQMKPAPFGLWSARKAGE
jgi:arylsulfatase A-like enzyme